jgi:hypothetical protein
LTAGGCSGALWRFRKVARLRRVAAAAAAHDVDQVGLRLPMLALNDKAAFFGPTVANKALRTWLDLQLAPPNRD